MAATISLAIIIVFMSTLLMLYYKCRSAPRRSLKVAQIPEKSIPQKPMILSTSEFHPSYAKQSNPLPNYKQQLFRAKTIEGIDHRKRVDTTNTSFYSRIGILTSTFEGPGMKDVRSEELKPFQGTATIFYVDELTKRVYAITAAHNLVHYNKKTTRIHRSAGAWFDHRVTSVPWVHKMSPSWFNSASSKSKGEYKIDQIWIHKQHWIHKIEETLETKVDSSTPLDSDKIHMPLGQNPGELTPYDLAIVSFCMNDITVFHRGYNPMLDKLPKKFGGLAIPGYPCKIKRHKDNKCLCEQPLSAKKTPRKRLREIRMGGMFEYDIQTSGGQSGSPIIIKEPETEKKTITEFKIIGIHTFGDDVDDKNGGVKLENNMNHLQWIVESVCDTNEKIKQKKDEVLMFFV
eukprot:129412_1